MLPTWYTKRKDFINTEIENYLDENLDGASVSCLEDFKKACLYACAGGKKLRAIFALEFYFVLQKLTFSEFLEKKDKHKDIIFFCLSLEFMHAYSLVHDDLPAMDNDTLRRGKPTVWKQFGEWNAILVGDALNTLSFQLLSEISDAVLSVKLSNLLSRSTGFEGMIGGQVMDLYFEEHPEKMNLKKLIDLHNKKTGALIKASVQGGILCSGKLSFLHKLSGFGEKIGLAFQIKDDILDVEGSVEKTGKSIGGEEKGFVYFLGLKPAKKRLKNLVEDCELSVKVLKSEHINFLVEYVGKREG